MPHCVTKIPIKRIKLYEVKAFPAKYFGKARATAGWVKDREIVLKI